MNKGTITVKATRDDRITSVLTGVIIPVAAGDELEIRPDILDEAMLAGCLPVVDKAPESKEETPQVVDNQVTSEELSEADRLGEIQRAMQKVLDTKDPSLFSSIGIPTLPAVIDELGYEIEEKERRAAWQKVKELATS